MRHPDGIERVLANQRVYRILAEEKRTAEQTAEDAALTEELEDAITGAIVLSLDVDWQPRDGGRAVIAYLKEMGLLTPLLETMRDPLL